MYLKNELKIYQSQFVMMPKQFEENVLLESSSCIECYFHFDSSETIRICEYFDASSHVRMHLPITFFVDLYVFYVFFYVVIIECMD